MSEALITRRGGGGGVPAASNVIAPSSVAWSSDKVTLIFDVSKLDLGNRVGNYGYWYPFTAIATWAGTVEGQTMLGDAAFVRSSSTSFFSFWWYGYGSRFDAQGENARVKRIAKGVIWYPSSTTTSPGHLNEESGETGTATISSDFSTLTVTMKMPLNTNYNNYMTINADDITAFLVYAVDAWKA